ncbi:DNA (cytosine-5-)-methyltransferase [Endozoicomonas sp. G2_1]|uniref:DNA cytosine methyltransferase n=1 Tax=Endozoicomonas sp. G2_1 TaxID=2821091 RepID=UPI001ADB6EDB|nr:DNA (cytosine-5-)-methyltransferase [Endozoicomonas sp. G2_1]MBO9490451.1 DNA (cytosine-5-)-methyltransferase [Endozoicomonas sp. G2_1]
MKFIDLFAGLGGFHTGFINSGYECVFACELEPHLRELYLKNYGIKPHGDITKVDEKIIPEHDVMCAGFPCQPFSLAGKKKGAECPESGKLIDHVIRIAKHHKPRFIVLENVPNVLTIAQGSFWDYMQSSFEKIGYKLEYKVISPVDVGIPQNRKRVFIVGSKLADEEFTWPEYMQLDKQSLFDILDDKCESKTLEPKKVELLAHWQSLLSKINLGKFSSVSLVAPEFGATYPLDFSSLSLSKMREYKGAYGTSLSDCKTWTELLERLPSYCRKNKKVANWLEKSVMYSRSIYSSNSAIIDDWSKSINKENNSWQILEWRGKHYEHNIYNHIVQFRASGIRILKPEIAPSLISMTPTQIPIIPSQNRYISAHEAAKLQNLHELKNLPEGLVQSFKALGNAVNAKVVELIATNLKLWKTA